jgi:DNA-binding SARP family transcriptional activator
MTIRPRFRVHLLGAIAIERDSLPWTGLSSQRKALALLALLAAAGRRGIGRDKVMVLLWPDAASDQARNALSQLLHRVRRELGEESVVGNGELRLDEAFIDTDISAFDAAIAAGRVEEACEIYAGPFLDGFYIRGAPDFERWTAQERDRREGLYHNALERLAVAGAEVGRSGDAAKWWKRRALAEPLSARVLRSYIEALIRDGDPDAALAAGAAHAALVRSELDAEPDPEITALLERVRRTRVAARSERPSPPPEPGLSPSAEQISEHALRIEDSARQPSARLRHIATRWTLPAIAMVIAVGVLLLVSSRSHGLVVEPYANLSGDTSLNGVSAELTSAVASASTAQKAPRQQVDITGFIFRHLDTIVVESRLATADSRSRLLSRVAVSRGSRAELLTRVPSAVAGGVAAMANPRVSELRFAAALPPFDAYRLYVDAVNLLSADGDVSAAVEKLRGALASDTTFTYAALWLTELEGRAAADSITRSFERRRLLLSPHEQALLDARAAADHYDFEGYYRLADIALLSGPDDPVAMHYAADAAMKTNRYASAAGEYRALRASGSFMAPLFSTWVSEVEAYHMAGLFETALQEWKTGQQAWPDIVNTCDLGVVQLGALGRQSAIDSVIAQCVPREMNYDMHRLGRRVGVTDELYRSAGRELLWHGYADAGRRALERAREQETLMHASDSTANNGWLAAELAGDWPATYRLMREEFGANKPCAGIDRRPICAWRRRLRFAVTAAHVGDSATARATLAWIDARPHTDSSYEVERAKILLALGRVNDALRSIRAAAPAISAADWLHANTELMSLRGDKDFESLIAPRAGPP